MLPEFEICRSEFEKYGLSLDEEQYGKLDIYAEFLVEYNKSVNLTAITEPHEILTKHFIDSILITKYIDIPENSSLIDVGTGAGFPSVPLKIYRRDISLTMLDSLAKRITFLEMLCEKLGIEAECIHGRAEDIARLPEYREKFDFSCARAVAGLSVLSEYCLPFVRQGGMFISLKGKSEDLSEAENAISVLGGKTGKIFDYLLSEDSRRLVLIKKISQIPTKYPRKSSQIKKNPL